MALDATTLFAITNDISSGSLVAWDRKGGAPRTLASDVRGGGTVAVDDERVMWTTWGTDTPHPGSELGELRAMPKSGGPSISLIGSFDAASLAADANGVCANDTFVPRVACLAR
jgi:hypothetical protein